MEKSTAERHLKFMNETIIPLAKEDTNEAAESMQSYCKENPDLVELYADQSSTADYLCGLFDGGDKMKTDIKDYVRYLKEFIEKN